MTERPTINCNYYVTAHRFILSRERLPEGEGYGPLLVEVHLHRDWDDARNEPPAHRVTVRADQLTEPPYQLGAIWELTFSGLNMGALPDYENGYEPPF